MRPGGYIPSSRQLADHLGVSRNTVLLAFNRLASEGYIEATKGSHSIVSQKYTKFRPPHDNARLADGRQDSSPAANIVSRRGAKAGPQRPKADISFFCRPPLPALLPHRTWRRLLLKRHAAAGSSLSEYPHPAGLLELRHAIADHLGAARGMNVRAAQIIVVNGIQEALNIIARLFVRPGTPVAIENPCFRGALSTFESYGAEMVPVPVDKDGIRVDQLPERAVACCMSRPRTSFPPAKRLPPNAVLDS